MKKIFILFIALSTMMGCTRQIDPSIVNNANGELTKGVYAKIADFFPVGFSTKSTLIQEGESAPIFSWSDGDVIGVIPNNGKTIQTNYEISDISSDPKTARFDGGDWALKGGCEYLAYYPFSNEAVTSTDSLDFSFEGQVQSSNKNLGHIGPYDVMYASAVSSSEGNATFEFKHVVSLVRLQITVPQADTYWRLELESNVNWFAKNAILSLKDGAFLAKDTTNIQNIGLSNIPIEAGETIDVWFSILPTKALEDNYLTIKLYGTNNCMTGLIEKCDNLEAGKAYSYSCVANRIGNQEYVDLGLPSGLKWATCNVGATKPEESGDYFAWGEIDTPYIYGTLPNPIWKEGREKGFTIEWYKWYADGTIESSNYPEGKLRLEDDAAHVRLGGNWRTPTVEEWKELVQNTTHTEEYINGVHVLRIQSKVARYTDKYIILPFAGAYSCPIQTARYQSRQEGGNVLNETGIYWSSNAAQRHVEGPGLGYGYNDVAQVANLDKNGLHCYGVMIYRDNGLPIRPVRE